MKFIISLIFSNLYIAFGAVCLYWVSMILLGADLSFQPITLIIFLSTFITYNALRIFGSNGNYVKSSDILSWQQKHLQIIKGLMILSLVVVLSVSFFLSIEIILIFAAASVITLIYILSIGKLGKLRKVPFLKTIIVAIVWTLIVGIVPLAELKNYSITDWFFISSIQFLFVLGLTIPFEVRDLETDLKEGIITFATHFGVKKTINTSILIMLLCFHLQLIYLTVYRNETNYLWISPFISSFIAVIILFQTNQNKKELWYTGLIDGILIIQFLSYWIVSEVIA